jgi:hypothetical protein
MELTPFEQLQFNDIAGLPDGQIRPLKDGVGIVTLLIVPELQKIGSVEPTTGTYGATQYVIFGSELRNG